MGKANDWGPQSKKSVDFYFDKSRTIAPAQMADWEAAADRAATLRALEAAAKACGFGALRTPAGSRPDRARMSAVVAMVPEARVGPTAVVQTERALRALRGDAVTAALFARAGVARWLEIPPHAMAGERGVAALHRVVAAEDPGALAEAGRRTADYLLAHRIPRAAQALMRALPTPLAARLLSLAVARNAWTIAGSGAVQVSGWSRPVIEIAGNPLATPGCPWHRAVFARLFGELAMHGAQVRHSSRVVDGAAVCRFEIRRP